LNYPKLEEVFNLIIYLFSIFFIQTLKGSVQISDETGLATQWTTEPNNNNTATDSGSSTTQSTLEKKKDGATAGASSSGGN
jgi:hypothetical protein